MANNIIRRTWKQNGMVNIEDLRGMTFQMEDQGHTFEIRGVNMDGIPIALSGTPSGILLRGDNQDVMLTCSVSDGMVYATMPANAYSVPGRFGITIFLTNNGQKTAIYAAVGSVSRTSSGIVAPPAGDDVTDLINAIQAAIAQIPSDYSDLMAGIAPTYSSSAVYAVGAYAWYNGKLYKCTTAIYSGETWNSNHWTLASMGGDVGKISAELAQDEYTMGLSFDEQIGGRKLFDPEYYENGRLNTAGNIYDDVDPHFTSDFIPVRGGQTINLNFALSDYHHRIAEYNASRAFIQLIPASSATSATIGGNTRYIRFNAPIDELNTAQITTPEGELIKTERYFDEIHSLTMGMSALNEYVFEIYDPSNDNTIGTEKGVEYTLPGNSFAVKMNITPEMKKKQRVFVLLAFSGALYPNSVIAYGIYDKNRNRISTFSNISKVHDNMNYSYSYIDLTDESEYDRMLVLFGYGFSSTGRKITIERFEALSDLPYNPASEKYIEVGQNREFPTFVSAFNYCKGSPSVNYHVRFYGNGQAYDISTESGNTDPNGLHIPENVVEIVGAYDRDQNIIVDSYNNGTGACFWIEYGTIIRNIYFKGTGKYCIHIDDPNNKYHNTTIENCRFYHATGGSGAIGIGFQAGYDLTIKNCWFEKDTDAGIRIHNWDYGNQNSNKLIIEGNKFSAGEMVHAVHLYTVSRYEYGYPIAVIVGNDFGGLDIMLSEEDYQSFGVGNHWRVWGHSNSETSVTITHHDDADYSGCVEVFMPTAEVTDTKL